MEALARRVVYLAMSGMTSAAFSAILALPDRPANPDPGPDVAPEQARPAAAASPTATRRARTCYQADNRQVVRLDREVADDEYGVAYDSQLLGVRRGSPCRDINVRDPRNVSGPAAGQSACTLVKVMFGGASPTGWVDTCSGWQVLVRLVSEGRPFVLRAALRPVDVTVAT